jgi:hypothetical protein
MFVFFFIRVKPQSSTDINIPCRTFMSGEEALGIDWMVMLLMLSISGSSRIDQQLGKSISMNLVTELFNKVPYTMYPCDAIQFKEYNPHMPAQEIKKLRSPSARSGCILRPDNKCILNDNIPMHERILVPSPDPRFMMEVRLAVCVLEMVFLTRSS